MNVFFIGGNSILLAAEVMSPLFGYWHGISEAMLIGMSLIGSYALNYYSTRMVNDLWLFDDGKTVEIEFMNAFFPPKRETYRIINFGYLQESRLYKVDTATYQQTSSVFVNQERNAFIDPEHNEVLRRILSGQELKLPQIVDSSSNLDIKGNQVKSWTQVV